MGTGILQIKRRLRDLIDVLEKYEDGFGDECKAVVEKLSRLHGYISTYMYATDDEGKYVIPKNEEIRKLKTMYNDTLIDFMKFYERRNKSEEEMEFDNVFKQIKEILFEDNKVIFDIDYDLKTSFAAAVDNATSIVLDLGEVEDASDKIPVEYVDANGIKHKGYFTKFDNNSTTNNSIATYSLADGLNFEHLTFKGKKMKVRIETKESYRVDDAVITENKVDFVDGLFTEIKPKYMSIDSVNTEEEKQIFEKWAKNKFPFSKRAIRHSLDSMIIDYLCFNKKNGNYLYKFNTDDPDNIYLESVVKEENSFSGDYIESEFDPDEDINVMGIKYITREMADKIKSLTPEKFKILIGKGLPAELEEHANNRLLKLQRAIAVADAKLRNFDETNVDVSRDTANKSNLVILDDLKVKPDDLFDAIPALSNALTKYEMYGTENEPITIDVKESNFIPAKVIQEPKETLHRKLKNKFNRFSELLDENDPLLHINSTKYKEMRNALLAIKDKYSKGISDEHEMYDLYLDLAEKCQAYIDAKKDNPSHEFGKNRLKFARKMMAFANERMEICDDIEATVFDAIVDSDRDIIKKIKLYYDHKTQYEKDIKKYNDYVLSGKNEPYTLMELRDNKKIREKYIMNDLDKISPVFADMILFYHSAEQLGENKIGVEKFNNRLAFSGNFRYAIMEKPAFKRMLASLDYDTINKIVRDPKMDANDKGILVAKTVVGTYNKAQKELDEIKKSANKQPAKENDGIKKFDKNVKPNRKRSASVSKPNNVPSMK